jgi:uncharacterized membrane protein YfcA
VSWETSVLGFGAGLVIALITAPVGVSGAVFLLPVQLSVLDVPNPAVTPTNLLYNVVATPGALARYARRGRLRTPLTRLLVVGTVPGVVAGAVLRVFVVPGPQVFRAIVAGVLLPLGVWLIVRTIGEGAPRRPGLSDRSTTVLAVAVGVVGGVYGIGGGSILGPILVGRGRSVAEVAPSALAATFVTSVVGSLAYAVLALGASGDISPDWGLGLSCGLGGLVGGYAGAHLQPYAPERALRLLLGVLAIAVAGAYAVQVLA